MSPAARMMTRAGEFVRSPNATRRMDDSLWVSESVCVHISVSFELLCHVFLEAHRDVCVCARLSRRTHHQEPQQSCDSSHYRLATPAWLIAGPGTGKQLHIPRHIHVNTERGQTFQITHLWATQTLANKITSQNLPVCHLTNLSYISNNNNYSL